MVLLKSLLLLLTTLTLSSCQLPYLTKTAYNHLALMSQRVDIKKVIEENKLSQPQIEKLKLAVKARTFAENELGLKKTNNYTQFVKIDRPYVSYPITVSKAYDLKNYTWWFPFVGSVPYKGFSTYKEAKKEASKFSKKEYDYYIGGASAYSTLGWFDDPILSTHLNFEDHSLVQLIIHETVHVTIYIQSNANFNERLATFIGQEGTKQFYNKFPPKQSNRVIRRLENEAHDEKLFSEFISQQADQLEKWYVDNKDQVTEEAKQLKLKSIQETFKKEITPQLKVYKYSQFINEPLTNAKILALKTYIYDQSDFKKALGHFNNDLKKLIAFSKSLEDKEKPAEALKELIRNRN